VSIYEAGRDASDRETMIGPVDGLGDAWQGHLRLGQDVRFVLVAVGGGAIRVASQVASQHIRHLETVAINCDPCVQGRSEFDRRIYLGPDTGAETDTGGSPVVGGLLARAAEPALDRIFRGATFVILVGSLGGGAGSGAFPHVLDVACRHAEVVSAFVIKPFRCEGERRALADRAIGRLQLVNSYIERHERGQARLTVLDNETLAQHPAGLAFAGVPRHWAKVVQEHIESSFVAPVESMIEAIQFTPPAEVGSFARLAPAEVPALEVVPPAPPVPSELPPILPAAGAEVELTFEVDPQAQPPPAP
jgi:Tubulin/FtsZ family, GTPase domain